MNRKTVYFIFLAILLTACSRFEEGPYFSLLSVKKRLARQWKVEYSVNLETGISHSADFEGWLLDFEKDGSFTRTIFYDQSQTDYKGNWEIIGSNRIRFDYNTNSGNATEDYIIQRLTKKQLWLKNSIEEIHYFAY